MLSEVLFGENVPVPSVDHVPDPVVTVVEIGIETAFEQAVSGPEAVT